MSRKRRDKPTAKELVEGLIISTGEARKLLAKEAEHMSDDEVAVLVLELHEIAPSLLKMSNSKDKQL